MLLNEYVYFFHRKKIERIERTTIRRNAYFFIGHEALFMAIVYVTTFPMLGDSSHNSPYLGNICVRKMECDVIIRT